MKSKARKGEFKEKYIETFAIEGTLREKLKERARREGISVSAVIRQAIEKELASPIQDEIYFPFADRYDQTEWVPLSKILESVLYSINKLSESHPELVRNFIVSFKKAGKRIKENKKHGRKYNVDASNDR